MPDVVTWGTLASIAAVLGLLLAVWASIRGEIRGVAKTATDASLELSEYKTHVAETYASRANMRELRDEIMTGVHNSFNDMKGSVGRLESAFEGMRDRMDRFIDSRNAATKRPNSPGA